MGKFTRDELQEAIQIYNAAHEQASRTGNWAEWAQIFTEDAIYIEHAFGNMRGRKEIAAWISDVMAPFPHVQFPHVWECIDEENDAFVFCAKNIVTHPKDPTKEFHSYNWSRVTYAGNGKFSSHEDMYNPIRSVEVFKEWLKEGGRLKCAPKRMPKWGPKPSFLERLLAPIYFWWTTPKQPYSRS